MFYSFLRDKIKENGCHGNSGVQKKYYSLNFRFNGYTVDTKYQTFGDIRAGFEENIAGKTCLCKRCCLTF